MIRSWITDVDSDHPKRVHPKDAFHYDEPNQCPTITQIMLHQRSWQSYFGQGFIGVFDAPRSEWCSITDVDSDHPKRVHTKVAFHCDDPNQCSTITQIMVHQRSWPLVKDLVVPLMYHDRCDLDSLILIIPKNFVLGCKVLSVEISYIHSVSTGELKNTARWNYSFAQPAFISIQLPR